MGKKLIGITDILAQYGVDKISCYERPIVNILEYINTESGNCFLLLSKLLMFFDMEVDDKIFIWEYIENYLGVNKRYNNREHSILKFRDSKGLNVDEIIESVNNNIPVCVACNLKTIYYSEHYGMDDWPHWMMITGYNRERKIFYLFDNTHMDGLGSENCDFCITFDMMINSYNSYVRTYGKENSVVIFKKGENQFDYHNALIHIIDLYLSIDLDDKRKYRQTVLLEKIREMTLLGGYEDIIEEYKKKLININKYKIVFIDKIIEAMMQSNYDKDKIDEVKKSRTEYEREMNVFLLGKILELSSDRLKDISVSDEIISFEKNLRSLVLEFQKFIVCVVEDSNLVEGTTLKCENSTQVLHSILTKKDDEYNFKFIEHGRYHWEEREYTPRNMIIRKDISADKVIIKSRILINSNTGNTNYMAGIYVKNDNKQKLFDKAYFAGINKDNLMLLGEFGEYASDTYGDTESDFTSEAHIYVEIEGNNIIFGEVIDDRYISRLKRSYSNIGVTEIGIFCTTWDDAKDLDVTFTDVEVDM